MDMLVCLYFRGLKTLVSRGRFQNTVSMDPGTCCNYSLFVGFVYKLCQGRLCV